MRTEVNLPTGMMFSPKLKEDVVEEPVIEKEEIQEESSKPVFTLTSEVEKESETNLDVLDESEETIFHTIARELVDEDLVDLDDLKEEDYSFEEWNDKSLKKFFTKTIESYKAKIEVEKEKAAKETYDYVVENMSPLTRKMYEFESKNKLEEDEVVEFAKGLIFEEDIKGLKPEDPIDAEIILKEYYRSNGDTLEEALERISNLKDPISEATKVKPKLDKKLETIVQNKIQEQDQILAFEIEARKDTEKRLHEIFKEKDLDGIPLTNQVKKFLEDVLIKEEVPMKIRGKEVPISLAEYLIRFNKFNKEQGDLKHLAKMLIFLQSKEYFEEIYVKKIDQRETERKIKENKEAAKQKTSLPILQKQQAQKSSSLMGMKNIKF